METLKEIRERLGVTQATISEASGITIPTLSNYEHDIVAPMVEDMIILERIFGTRLEWNDRSRQKVRIVQSLNYLFDHYPVASVVNFASRWMRNDNKIAGVSGILHFVNSSQLLDEEIKPLIPPTFKPTKK